MTYLGSNNNAILGVADKPEHHWHNLTRVGYSQGTVFHKVVLNIHKKKSNRSLDQQGKNELAWGLSIVPCRLTMATEQQQQQGERGVCRNKEDTVDSVSLDLYFFLVTRQTTTQWTLSSSLRIVATYWMPM